MKERKARVDDALHATKSAAEEGIVPGGGIALIRAQSELDELAFNDDRDAGVNIVRRAIEEPIRQIVSNAGLDAPVVLDKIKNKTGDAGFNASSGKYENLFKAGVIDSTKVVRVALQNAASVSGLMLTTRPRLPRNPKSLKPR